jgi:hypothetical protein
MNKLPDPRNDPELQKVLQTADNESVGSCAKINAEPLEGIDTTWNQ